MIGWRRPRGYRHLFFLSGFLTDFLWRRVGISHRFFLISHRFHGFHRFFAAVGVSSRGFHRFFWISHRFHRFHRFFAAVWGKFSQISRISQIFRGGGGISHRFHRFHRFFCGLRGDFSRISQIFFGFLTDFTDFTDFFLRR